jgi:nitroimidazol reductase NimA-like FMN-containing flavoprotein (pyridoxamine 5'-phosphate oxidase superfamily)
MIDHRIGTRLDRARIAWLTSVRPDHSPHTVPVWFVRNDNDVWVASSPTSRKVMNLRGNDRISVAIDGSTPNTLVAQARAEILDDLDSLPEIAEAFAAKYDGFDITNAYGSGPLVLMRLGITRWLLDGSPQ